MAGGGPRPKNMAPAPDGGWGWVIVMASFTLQALTIGITYTFGILLVELLDEFKKTESTTSWIGSIQPCLLYFTGIVTGPLIQKFGWRMVTIVGSIISAIGFFTSSFAPNVYMLYFTYGVLTGVGNGLMYLCSMVAVQFYFEKRRAMATGIAVSGSGVGILVSGILTEYFITTLGWRMTLRIQALAILLGAVCGILMRPLPLPKDNSGEVKDDMARSMEHSARYNGDADTESSGAVTSYVRSSSVAAADDDSQEVPSVEIEEGAIGSRGGCCGPCTSCLSLFNFSLFKNPVFVMFCLTIVFFCYGYHVPYAYTPERAAQFNISSTKASSLVSVMGIANVASRLVFGWVGDRSYMIRCILGAFMVTAGGVVSCCISLFRTHKMLVVYSSLFGCFTGCWASLFPVLLGDMVGVDVIDQSLGQCLASGSIAFLTASPIAGLIIEKTGSYDAPFQVVGGLETLGGVIFIFTILLHWHRTKYERFDVDEEDEKPKRRRYVSESFS